MATFTWIPDYGASVDTKPTVLKSKFGDGYEQRVGDGINLLPRKWNLNFYREPSEIASIISFLEARYGVEAFDWTPYVGSAGKWVCSEWKHTITDFGAYSVSCTFEEVFEP